MSYALSLIKYFIECSVILITYLNIELKKSVLKHGGELILILCIAIYIFIKEKQGLVKLNLDEFV